MRGPGRVGRGGLGRKGTPGDGRTARAVGEGEGVRESGGRGREAGR